MAQLPPEPDQLRALIAGESVVASAPIAVGLGDPIANRLGARLELLCQGLRGPPSPGQRDQLLAELRGYVRLAIVESSVPNGEVSTKPGQLQFNIDGAMVGLVDSAWGAPWEMGKYAEKAMRNDDGVSRLPLWIQRKNSFAFTLPDTLEDSPIYDGQQRLTGWTQKKNGTQIGAYTYGYDTDGNISTTGGAEVYAANTDRLLSRTDGAGHLWKYFYDRAGNLVTARDSQPGSAATVWSYTYDALDRLTAVARTGVTGPVARYGYDLLGRRIVKRVYSSATGGTTQYLRMSYRGNRVSFEADSGGAIGWKYIWGLGVDQLVVAVNASGHHTISSDRLGSIRAVQLSGAWLQFQWYTPYAEVTTVDGTSAGLRYGWTGREYDAESGLYFHRSRYYDPRQRRFVQEDPIGFSGGANLYAYVSGRPLEATDPSGLSPDGEHFRSISPPECCHVGYSAWTNDFNNNGLDDLDELLDYVWRQKCNLSGGCVVYADDAATKAAAQECHADPVCRASEGRLAVGGHKIVVGQYPGGSGPAEAIDNEDGTWGIDLNFGEWAAFQKDPIMQALFYGGNGALLNAAIVLTHEFGHAEFGILTSSVTYSVRGSNAYAIYWENQARRQYTDGGCRLRHDPGQSYNDYSC